MKVTSFELSKKLWHIGFQDESYDYVYKDNTYGEMVPMPAPVFNIDKDEYPAYDLETVLEAIRTTANIIRVTFDEIECQNIPLTEGRDMKFQYWEERIDLKDNESIVNGAARLLILLFEQGLIKFE